MATSEEVQAQITAAMSQMSIKFQAKLEEQNALILSQQGEIQQLRHTSHMAQQQQQPQQQPQQQHIPAPHQQSRSEDKIRRFNGDVQKIHGGRNPDFASLLYDGSNYQIWEREINRTLGFVFDTPKAFLENEDNFSVRAVDEQSSISALLRSTIHKDLRAIVDGSSEQSALDLFKLIKLNCSHSNQQYKLKIVDQLLALSASKSPGSELVLAKWTKIFTDIEQLKIPTNELCGLILQSSFIAPAGVDKKTFDFSIDSKLEARENANFADVTTVIQSACGKGKNKSSSPSTDSYTPMELDAISAMRNQAKYLPPAKREPAQKAPALSYEKALYWRGQPTPESLRAKYGDECHRCGSVEHWYNNCSIYWEDVKSGLIPPPLKIGLVLSPPIDHQERSSRLTTNLDNQVAYVNWTYRLQLMESSYSTQERQLM
ncbi:hypothetical protein Pst134EB_018225 [Puccinia striiformis f. sp. tritici]|nr:hypothetical protein Pst134EB_018225 [Puccinia striiformis f. sp. tritici]